MSTLVGKTHHLALRLLNAAGVAQTNYGFLLRGRGYSKQDASVFAPRFGTGEQGLSDLDLWRTYAQTDVSGGSFDPKDHDPKKAALVTGAYSVYDGILYPIPNVTVSGFTVPGGIGYFNYANNTNSPVAKYLNEVYTTANEAGGAGKGGVMKFNGTNWVSVKTDFATAVTSLSVLSNKLWVTTNGGLVWCFDGTTWTSDNRYGFTLAAPFNGKLYCNGSPGGVDSGKLWSRDTGVGTAGVATYLGEVGDSNKAIRKFLVYNHRLYMLKEDGLFAYDGLQISTIIDDTSIGFNILTGCVFNGVLYFVSNNRLMSFNGSTVTLINDFTGFETLNDVFTAGDGRMYITTTQIADDGLGGKFTSSATTNRVYYFNGTGIFLMISFQQAAGTISIGSPNVVMAGAYRWFLYGTYDSAGPAYNIKIYRQNYAEEVAAKTSASLTAAITSAVIDAGFPQVTKTANSVLVQTQNLGVSDTCKVYIRTNDGQSWTSWTQLGLVTPTVNRLYFKDTPAISQTWKQVQVECEVSAASGSRAALRGFALEYLLSPDHRWQWQAIIQSQGTTDAPLELLDGTTETNSPAKLREILYEARATPLPILFTDIDFNALNGAHTNVVTTITVNSTDTFDDTGIIQVDDELITYTGRTTTTFTGCTRGAFGTTAASHLSAAVVNKVYRAVLTKIPSESVIIPNLETTGQESDLTVQIAQA